MTHRVVASADDPERFELGADSRDGRVREAHSPLVVLDPQGPVEGSPVAAGALLAAVMATLAALTQARRVPTPVKGLVAAAGVVAAATAAYAAWWSPLPPLDVAFLPIDWRTSALIPAAVGVLVLAYDLLPVGGSIVLKAGWTILTPLLVFGFSCLRLAVVASAYDTFGPVAFLPAFALAGTFLDLLPVLGILAVAHATSTVPEQTRSRWFLP